jgi:DNA polymerase-3 subunit gamma/tau
MPSYLVLARKYRPATFQDVVGQDHVIRTLVNSIASGRVAHAFLFCGVRGVGKTTVARILAKALNCTQRKKGKSPDPCNKCSSCKEITDGVSVDVQEIDGASHTSVDNIREINENIKYPPISSQYKIIIIDEVHMISINAFNALLKTLEEPPAHAKFIFATTEAHKVPATINSRCQRFNFRTITIQDMIDGMKRILKQEGVDAAEEALALVAREAQGSFRDALSLLDQVIAFGSGSVTADDVVSILGIGGRDALGRLVTAVLDSDAAECLKLALDLFQQGFDPEQLALDMIGYLRNLIVVATVPQGMRGHDMVDASAAELGALERLAARTTSLELQNLFGILVRGETEIKRSGNPWVALEMTLLRMAHAPQLTDLSEILRKIDAKQPSRLKASPGAAPGLADRPPAAAAVKQSTAPKEVDHSKSEVPEPGTTATHNQHPSDRFVITRVSPMPEGDPDEIWASIKKEIASSGTDPALVSLMDHGNLISVGPTEVEIGFNKPFYRSEFERRLEEKPEIRGLFEEFFGDAGLKIMTLAEETSLAAAKPYSVTDNGESDRNRALKQEALDHPLVKAIRDEFADSTIEEIKILS